MRIRYFCHYGALTGHGRAARDYLAAIERELAARNAERWGGHAPPDADDFGLEIVPYEACHGSGPRPTSPEARYAHLDRYVRWPHELVVEADVEVHHGPPRLLAMVGATETWPALEVPSSAAPTDARRRIALTTWETDTFPVEYIRGFLPGAGYERVAHTIEGFDLVVVPSWFCQSAIANAIRASGLPGGLPVVIPHCYDPGFWVCHWNERVGDYDATPPFRFYTVGAWNERKNPQGVVRAYLAAFTAEDQVELVLACGGVDVNELRSLVARSGLAPAAVPKIIVPENAGAMTEESLRNLHAMGDCYVSATRGEGWGLGLFEAAAMQRWIISPLFGGQEDFLELVESYPWLRSIEHQLTPCFGSEIRGEIVERDGRMMQMSRVSIPPGVTCRQMWAEPYLGQLVDQMKTVYSHVNRLAGRIGPGMMETIHGRRGGRTEGDLDAHRSKFAAKYGYAAIGRQFVNLLQEISAL